MTVKETPGGESVAGTGITGADDAVDRTGSVGTRLPVETTADLWPVFVMGMGDDQRPREKHAPNGRVTFSSGGLLRVMRNDGTVRTDKSASVHVLNMNESGVLEPGRLYRAEGIVWVQPYEANSRVALSITVERLVEVK